MNAEHRDTQCCFSRLSDLDTPRKRTDLTSVLGLQRAGCPVAGECPLWVESSGSGQATRRPAPWIGGRPSIRPTTVAAHPRGNCRARLRALDPRACPLEPATG